MVFKLVRLFFIGCIMFGVTSCNCSNPPEKVAGKFWKAFKENNIAKSQNYCTTTSRNLVNLSDKQFQHKGVIFGKIIIDRERVDIETVITNINDKSGELSNVSFFTILERENNRWLVNYQLTKENATIDNPIDDFINDLKTLGKGFMQTLDKTLTEVEKNMPEYEEKINTFFEELSKEMEQERENPGTNTDNNYE